MWALELQGGLVYQDSQLIVTAIESLQQTPNFFKDYIFPISSAFFTSILGAVIAYFTLSHQENIQIEKEKMNTSNKWTIEIEQARAGLIAIKRSYNDNLTDLPLERLAAVPCIMFHARAIPETFHELSFIVGNKEDSKSELPKWSQIPRIRSMVYNYNYLLKLWERRNEVNQKFQTTVLESVGGEAYANFTREGIEKIIGRRELVLLIDFTERCISLTDDLIIELDSFLLDFPSYVKTRVNLKKLKKYGTILNYSHNSNEALLKLLEKSPQPDFSSLEDLFGDTNENIKKTYKNRYFNG